MVVKLNWTERRLVQRDDAVNVCQTHRYFDNWKKGRVSLSKSHKPWGQNFAQPRAWLTQTCGGRACVSPEQSSAPPSRCYVSSLRWASAGWRGQVAPLGSWGSGTACLAVWQPLLSTVPLYPLEALSHNWKTFLASLGGTHRSLPKHSLGGLSLRDLGFLPYVSSDLFEWMVWMLRLKYKLWQFSEMHHAT